MSTSINIDSIKHCLVQFLSLYDMRVDVDGIIENLSIDPEDETITEEDVLKKALAKIDCKTNIATLTPEQISACEMPVIVLVDGALYLQLPEHTHEGALLHIGTGPMENTLAELYSPDATLTTLIVTPPITKGKNPIKATIAAFKTYDWFWKELLEYKPSLIEILLCSVFMNFFALALPLYTMNIYDRVVVSFAESTLFALTLGVFIVIIFDFLFKFIRSYALEAVSSKLSVTFDMTLMEKIIHTRSHHMELSIGELTNMFRELHGVKNFFAISFITTIIDLPFFLLFALIIYIISPAIVLVPVLGAITIITANLFAYHMVEQSTQKHIAVLQNKTKILVEMLSGVEAMQSSGQLGNRMLHWKRMSANCANLLRKHSIIMAFTTSISGAVTYLVQILVVFVGVYQINAGDLTIGGLIACSILSGRAMAPVMRLPDLVSSTRKALEVLKITHPLFANEDAADPALAPKGPFEGAMQLRDVSFQYPKQQRPALNNVSMQIAAGEKVGIIGMSGAGKSTLANLLTGIVSANTGEVLLDEYMLHLIPRTELKRTIGYLPQNPAYFEGSIRENILMGRNIADDELNQVMQISGLSAVIKSTGMGVDAEVEPMGGNLSPGQKQTIAIARALVGDPEIVIFDEPTTGMDNTLEAVMQSHIKPFVENKTFIVITHKTTLLPLVDRLIVLNQGTVVADGPRDEVLKKIAKKN